MWGWVSTKSLRDQNWMRLHRLHSCWSLFWGKRKPGCVYWLFYALAWMWHITSALSPLAELVIRTCLVVRELELWGGWLRNGGEHRLCHSLPFWLSELPWSLQSTFIPSLGKITKSCSVQAFSSKWHVVISTSNPDIAPFRRKALAQKWPNCLAIPSHCPCPLDVVR